MEKKHNSVGSKLLPGNYGEPVVLLIMNESVAKRYLKEYAGLCAQGHQFFDSANVPVVNDIVEALERLGYKRP